MNPGGIAGTLVCCVLINFQAIAQSGLQRVWAIDDGERIKQTATNDPLRTSPNNVVWSEATQSISLFGARNEFVAFQLIIEANATGATNVNVKLDSVRHSDGFTISNLGWNGDPYNYVNRHIEMFVMHYMNIDVRTDASYIWWGSGRPGAPGDPYWANGDFLGLQGEQLVPFEAPAGPKTNGQGGAPFSVAPSRLQSIWVDLYIPKSAPPGLYNGTMAITEEGILRFLVPVSLRVYGFTLSDTTHIPNTGYLQDYDVASRHRLPLAYETTTYHNMVKRYMAFGKRHRLNIQRGWQTPQNHWAFLKEIYTGSYFTPVNGYYGPGEGLGPNLFHIGVFDQPNKSTRNDRGYLSGFGDTSTPLSQIDADTIRWRNLWNAASNMWVDSFSVYAPGVSIAKYGPEEPSVEGGCGSADTSVFYDMRRKSRWLAQNPGSGGSLKYTVTMNFRPEARNIAFGTSKSTHYVGPGQSGYTPSPGTCPYNPYPSGMVLDSLAVWQDQLGIEVGLYGGGRPGWASQVIDAPAIDQRSIAWFIKKHNIRGGFRFWVVNHFGTTTNRVNPWYRDYRSNTWGDGTLIYHGQEEEQFIGNDRGLAGPIAGVRLKNWRRGMQDYEYLVIAQQLGLNTTPIVSAIVNRAFNQLPQNAPVPLDGWAQRGFQYENARRQLAELIENGTPVPFPTGTFTATPEILPSGGGSVTLNWSSQHATSASIDNGVGVVPVSGSVQVNVTTSTVFHLTLSNSAGSQALTVPVTVVGSVPPPDGTFLVSPESLPAGGGDVTLIWVSNNATTASIDNGLGSVSLNGSLVTTISSSTTFRLTLSNQSGSTVLEANVGVASPLPVPTGTFIATPDSLPTGGGNSTLIWVSQHATAASIDNGIGTVPVSGSHSVNVTSSGVYTLTLSNASGSQVLTVPIQVAGTPPPPSGTFSASPSKLPPGGGNVNLTWTSQNATDASIDNGIGTVPFNGSHNINVTASTVFRLSLSNQAGTQNIDVPVQVEENNSPPSGTFIAAPDSLPAGGGNVTLIWVSNNAATASIDNGIGSVPLNGSQVVNVSSSGVYTLTLANVAGSNTLTASIRVAGTSPPPTGTFSASVDTLPPGGGMVALTWTSQNATSVSIDNGIGTVPFNGSTNVNVTASTVFRLFLTNEIGTQQIPVSVHVRENNVPPAGTFVATPDSLPAGGGEVTLIWVSSNAASASIDNGVGAVPVNGSTIVTVTSPATFVLTLTNNTGNITIPASVVVGGLPPMPDGTLLAVPDSLPAGGGQVTLVWVSSHATSATIDNGIGPVPVNGSLDVNVSSPRTFTLTLTNQTGSHEVRVNVKVGAPPPLPTGTFFAIPDTLPAGGGNVSLIWVSSHAATATLDQGIGNVPVNGSISREITTSTIFSLTLSNTSGSNTLAVPVIVRGTLPPLPTGSFTASPDTLPEGGGDVTLTWTSIGADSAFIDQGIGNVPTQGSVVVSAGFSKTYTLRISNIAGSQTYSASVYVPLPSAGPVDITVAGAPLALVSTPTGTGNRNIEVIRDGLTPPPGSSNPMEQYDTYDGNTSRTFDWVGYSYEQPQVFSGIMFQEGIHFPDGGWFETLRVQVNVGEIWKDVDRLVCTPPYTGNNGIPYEQFDLTFTPVTASGIRVAGRPGGSARYISVGELRVLRPYNATAPAATFLASSDSLPSSGGYVTLHWSVANASSVFMDNGIGNVPFGGSVTVQVTSSRTFTLTASNGTTTERSSVSVMVAPPVDYTLEANYPNPFNPTTNIRFALHAPTHVTLKIYDILGREIRTLHDGLADPGITVVEWDGKNENGILQASGTYIYRLRTENFVEAKRMVMMK